LLADELAHTNDEDVLSYKFQLEKGITLQGTETSQAKYYSMLHIRGRCALVMKDGSKITGHYRTGNVPHGSVIYISAVGTTYKPRWAAQYLLVIEAGAQITGNKLNTVANAVQGDVSSYNINNDMATVINCPYATVGELNALGIAETVSGVTKPVIYISKDAVIENNVREGGDNVNIVRFGLKGKGWVSIISSDEDNFIPRTFYEE
jgi:hypothetical protein